MKKFLENISPKTFKIYSFCIALLGDGFLLAYIYLKFSNKELFLRILQEAWKAKGLGDSPSISFATELFMVWKNSLIGMLVLVGVFHLIIYLLWHNGKKSPTKYVLLYFKVAMIGFPLMGLALLSHNTAWGVLFILLAPLYYFCLSGMSYFSKDKN